MRRACGLVLACLLSAVASSAAPDKPIRLRNQPSGLKVTAENEKQPSAPASGLFLVQFAEAPRPEWREQLRALGVELLRFVPEDAFVAKFDSAAPGQIRKLGFVTAVTAYLPEHKLHRRLISPATNGLDVAVLAQPKP